MAAQNPPADTRFTNSGGDAGSARGAEVHAASVADLPSLDDHLGFKPYVQALHRFLTNDQTRGPLTISIEGEWGVGKSSFMEQLAAALAPTSAQESRSKPLIVRFNAWRHDRADELWAAFALEFVRKVTQALPLPERYRGHLRLARYRFRWGQGWPDVARAIIWAGIAILILGCSFEGLSWLKSTSGKLAAGAGIIATSLGALVTALTWLARRLGNPLKLDLKQHIKSPKYEEKISFLGQFHEDFANILRAYVGTRRVFVLVDDLDRCEVPKAAELMQALNLMLSGDNELFFILGMDRHKVAAGVALKHAALLPYLRASDRRGLVDALDLNRYGLQFGYEFIEKFIQIPVVIPQPSPEGIRGYVRSLSREDRPPSESVDPPEQAGRREQFRLKVTSRDSEEILRVVERVAPALGNNPRRVKLFLNVFRLRLLTAVETGLLDVNEDQEILTLDQLGTFVALCVRWPLLIAEAAISSSLLESLEGRDVESQVDNALSEFLRASPEPRLASSDIQRLLRALPQVRPMEGASPAERSLPPEQPFESDDDFAQDSAEAPEMPEFFGEGVPVSSKRQVRPDAVAPESLPKRKVVPRKKK